MANVVFNKETIFIYISRIPTQKCINPSFLSSIVWEQEISHFSRFIWKSISYTEISENTPNLKTVEVFGIEMASFFLTDRIFRKWWTKYIYRSEKWKNDSFFKTTKRSKINYLISFERSWLFMYSFICLFFYITNKYSERFWKKTIVFCERTILQTF